MSALASILAINWEPELRGVIVVLIGVSVLMGSVYLILGTNLGARLGFLVAFSGLAGWMALMGMIWAIYGIGLKGPEPTWDAVPGRTVLQDTAALFQGEVLDAPVDVPEGLSHADESAVVAEQFQSEGWTELDASSPAAGQAGASAAVYLEETGAFAAGEFQVTRVFDVGGDRYPKVGSFDLLAFFHEPHYAVVEVAALEQTRSEPGRPAPASQIDESRQRQYVYMIRNLGARRQPAFVLAGGAGIIFVALCYLLHKRDVRVRENRTALAPAAGS